MILTEKIDFFQDAEAEKIKQERLKAYAEKKAKSMFFYIYLLPSQ